MSSKQEYLIRESVRYLIMQHCVEYNNDFNKKRSIQYFEELIKSMVNNTPTPVLPSCITVIP